MLLLIFGKNKNKKNETAVADFVASSLVQRISLNWHGLSWKLNLLDKQLGNFSRFIGQLSSNSHKHI